MIINDVELEFDAMDLDTMTKFEAELQKIQDLKNQPKPDTASGTIRQICDAVFAFFDAVWGPGTAQKVTGGKYNMRICMDAFAAVIDQAKEQQAQYAATLNAYTPNRAQRRAKK